MGSEPLRPFRCLQCGGVQSMPTPPPSRPHGCPIEGCAGEMVDLAEALTARSDVPPEVTGAAAHPRNIIGKYVLVSELGHGGMGTVYKAWDTSLRRWAAMKFLHGLGSEEDLKRFTREAQTAAAIRHPNIAGIYEVGESEGKPFIAMEYLNGKPLAGVKPGVRRACEIMRDVALALGEAHRRSIIHRDLKPANIILDTSGRPAVVDFGLAKSMKDQAKLTMSGTVVGTPCYMAPEQAQGEAHRIDRRTDVYQLGATLYELVTGQPPFRGASAPDILRKIVDEEVVPPSKLANVPRDVETIILRAMQKDRVRRYATAGQLAEDLERYLEGRPISARRTSGLYRLSRFLARRKAATVAAVAVTLLAVIGIAALVSDDPPAPTPKPVPLPVPAPYVVKSDEAARKTSRPAYDRGMAELDEAQKNFYRTDADLVRTRARLGDAIAAFTESLSAWPKNPDALVARGRAHAFRFEEEAAEKDFTRALELQPDLRPARDARGKLLLQRYLDARLHLGWNWSDVVAEPYDRWKKQAQKDLVDPAFVAFAEDRKDDCLKLCEERLAGRPELEEIHKLMGDALLLGSGFHQDGTMHPAQAQILATAIRSYGAALKLRPNYYEARMMRGYALVELGNSVDALKDIQVALRLKPEDALAFWFMGKTASDPAEALSWYDKGIAIRPESFICRMNRASALGKQGKIKEAEKELDRTIGLNPAHYYPYYLRGALRSKHGDMTGAYHDFQKTVKMAPSFQSGWFNLGAVCYNTQRFRESVKAFEQALRTGHPQQQQIRKLLEQARARVRSPF